MTRARLRRPGALALLMVCFLLSGVLRVADPESALAGEIDDALGAMRRVSSHSGGKAGETLTAAEIDLLFEELKERETQLEVMRQDLATRAQPLAVTEEKLREQLEVELLRPPIVIGRRARGGVSVNAHNRALADVAIHVCTHDPSLLGCGGET